MVLLETTLTFTGLAVVKGLTALYVRYENNKEYDKMKNFAPLLVYEKLDRVRHATEEANQGFNECDACGFENFKSRTFCDVCGSTIGKAGKKRAKKLKYKNPLNARFVRASKRKEWVRKVSAEGKAYWHRQEHLVAADARFPGFVVMFQLDDGGALGPEGEEKTAQLVHETETLCLELIESTKADPWVFALGGSLKSNELEQEAMANASLNFPAKYAAFVTKAAAALQPTKKIQLRLTLNRDYMLEQSLEHVSCMDVKYAHSEVALKFLNDPRAPVGKQNREWIAQLSEMLTNPNTGLFKVVNNSEQTYYLNANSKIAIGDDHLTYFYAAGRLLGRGLLDGALWGFHLATPLLKTILGLPVSFTDLEFFDPETYKSLEYLANSTDVESLSLDFSVTEKVNGKIVVIDLIPNGRNVAVTDANKFEYLERRFKYTLFESVSSQLYAFLRGIHEVVQPEMLLMLDPEELDFIMCGSDVINVHDWRINSKYNECIHGHPCMNWFWKYVRKMPLEYKKRLLHFTTGNTRVPIGGFAALTNYNGDIAPFTIVGNELVMGRLMRGQPCFNKLELPNYVHRKHLKSMLFGILDNYDYTSKQTVNTIAESASQIAFYGIKFAHKFKTRWCVCEGRAYVDAHDDEALGLPLRCCRARHLPPFGRARVTDIAMVEALLLEVGGSCLALWAIASALYLYMMRASRRTPREIELRAPLVAAANAIEYRLDAALREAEDGYNACTTCGFENFKRFPFCSLCGDEIVAWKQDKDAKDAAALALQKLCFWRARALRSAAQKAEKVEILGLYEQPHQASTQRQQRARKRKEWTRKLDLEGRLFWYRDTTGGASDAFFPGYAVIYRNAREDQCAERETTEPPDAEVISVAIEAANDPITNRPRLEGNGPEAMESPRGIQLSRQDREGELNQEADAVAMDLVDPSLADPGCLPDLRSWDSRRTQNVVRWRDVLNLSTQPFPAKYAHFVMATAALITPAECEIIKLNVKRGRILEDSVESLSVIPLRSVRSVMRINFVAEAGVDAGGLHREWFVLLNKCLTDPATGVFQCPNKHEQTFFLSANSQENLGENHLVYFFATGRLIGRALLEGYTLDFHLCLPLIKIMLGLPVTFSDLEYFDPETYKSLLWMLENDDVGALGLDFSVTEKQRNGEVVVVDLIPNGRSIDVTDDNKDEYVERRFRYMLFESVSSQLYVFLKGLYEVIPQELLMLFDPEEFGYLLCGSDEIDVDDWEQNTICSEELDSHVAVKWFWELVREMPNEYRRRLLHFATGSSRVPITGFSSLTSYDDRLCPFTLRGVVLKDDGYIWSHACFNRLDLPLHVSRPQLKAVLYAAIETDTYGFTTH